MVYKKEIYEKFAIKEISLSFNRAYAKYEWKSSEDNFDFVSPDGTAALEVVTIIPKNYIEEYEYNIALEKGKNPDPSRVKSAHLSESKKILWCYGGSMSEIRELIQEYVCKKEQKRQNREIRKKKFDKYELCICVEEAGLFYKPEDFDFIIERDIMTDTKFSRIFIITCNNFYVIENNTIIEYQRIYIDVDELK